MQPLPIMQRSRAALWSVAGHGGLIAALALVHTRTDLAPFQPDSPLIFAELVLPAAPVADTVADAEIPAAERSETPAGEPAPRGAPEPIEPEPIEPATVAPASPPPALPEAEPRQPPSPSLDPIAEPLPKPRLAEAERPLKEPLEVQSPPEQLAEAEQPAEPEPTPERVAEALEPAPPAPPLPEPAPVPELPAGLPEPEPSIAREAPRRTLANHEAETVRRKLSSWTGRFSGEDPEPTMRWRDDGQEYTAVLRRVPAGDAMGMEQLAVELTTERDGERLVTELRMNRLAFSNFGQFINRWDSNVQIHDDVIDGRLHSNTALTIGRSGGTTPIFRGKVTIADGGFVTPGPGFISKQRLFPAGIETRARRIAMPQRAAALEEVAGPANSQRFTRDTALTFHAGGTVSWRETDGGAVETQRALGEQPFYLLGGDDVDLEVSGTVNGKVLVYARERIVITDDLRYAADPRTPDADDYLGLVAERSVEIAEPEVTGSGDLTVFASIYARHRFAVRNYASRRSGTLVIYGSLTAGTLTATEPRFATRIEFDDRLTAMRAPSFPLTDRYELDSVSGEWRVLGAVN